MSAKNHTPVATQAAANASVINAPLGQLDAAMGDLATLTTTNKTDLAGAINELDAAKMDTPGSQAANQVYASPSGAAGAPGFRALTSTDLPASGATAGTFTKVTIDGKGRVTSGSNVQTSDISDISSYPMDTLGAPTDVTTHNASISKHGFMPKLINDALQFINGIGNWVKWACGIKYNGSAAYTPRSYIDFRGAVSIQDDPAGDALRVTITGGGSGGGASTLDDLTDVSIVNPATGNTLAYNPVSGLWENTPISSMVATGHTIQDEGSNLTQRSTMNFSGPGVSASDDAANNRTNVTITQPVKASGAELITGTDDANFATAKALKDAKIIPDGDAGNVLINGGFDLAQRQTPGTLTTILTDTYSADRFRISSQAAGLQYQRISALGETGLASSFFGRYKRTTNAGKDMIYQILESFNSVPFRGRKVIFQVKLRSNAERTLRLAIVELQTAGAEDTIPGTFVSNWGANGTDPTLGANLAAVAAAQSITVTTSWQTFSISVTVPSDSKNLIPVIWTDQQTQVNDNIDVGECGFFPGDTIRNWNPRLAQQELAVCERYCKVRGAGTFEGNIQTSLYTIDTIVFWLSTKMRTVPTVSHNASGVGRAADKIAFYNYRTGVDAAVSSFNFHGQLLNQDYFNMRLDNVTNGAQNDVLQCVLGADVKIIASSEL